jgi:3-hydroxybutyryl-CoA dehydrogenase
MTSKNKIETIAVIGAGPNGRSIARDAILAGYQTVLEDISHERLEQADAWIRQMCAAAQPPGKTAPSATGPQPCCGAPETGSHRDAARVVTTSKLEEAIREADLIIETVAEELEMKIELFTIFDKFAKPNAILASTTPWLSVAEMAAVTFCRDRCIGMKVVHEGPEMNRVELVVTSDTSKPTIEACWGVAQRLGKEVVLVRETDSGIGSWRKGKGAGG